MSVSSTRVMHGASQSEIVNLLQIFGGI